VNIEDTSTAREIPVGAAGSFDARAT